LYRRGEVHAGFRVQGLGCCENADFYSDALVERRLAPLPLVGLPLTIVWDVATTPPLLVVGLMVFAWGK
jgi:hypothetical protein